MKKILHFSSLFLVGMALTCAMADTVGFAVVAPGATSVSVSVGGASFALLAPISDVPYFNGTASVTLSNSTTYQYIVDGTAETFMRTFPAGRVKTYNDFYGRQQTIQVLSQLGWPFSEDQHWDRALGPAGVFDDDYISTMFFTGSNSLDFFASSKHGPSGSGMTVTLISKDDIGYFEGCAAQGQNGDEIRMGIEIYLPEYYHGRSVYKLRPSNYDPIFFREKIYNDVLEAIGVPHEETSFVRVYVEAKGLGFYHLQEDTTSYDFIVTQFYGQTVAQPANIGVYYDCSTGADFEPGNALYAFQPVGNQSFTPISDLITAVTNLNDKDDAAIATFNTDWFDINSFFRAICMEYLTGSFDSYWFSTTNFVMYNDVTENQPNTERFYFVDQDFDQTFGVDILGTVYDTYGAQITSTPYTVYVNRSWTVTPDDAPHRVMVDKLLSNPTYKAKFESTLSTIVKSIFNPIALGRRIEAVAGRVRPEIVWDRSLGTNRARLQTSNSTVFTIDDFDNGFNTSIAGDWGFMSWIEEMSSFVASEFSITFDNPPLDPPANGNSSTSSTSTSFAATTGRTNSSQTSGGLTSTSGMGATSGGVSSTSSSSTTQAGETSGETSGEASGETTGDTQSESHHNAASKPVVSFIAFVLPIIAILAL